MNTSMLRALGACTLAAAVTLTGCAWPTSSTSSPSKVMGTAGPAEDAHLRDAAGKVVTGGFGECVNLGYAGDHGAGCGDTATAAKGAPKTNVPAPKASAQAEAPVAKPAPAVAAAAPAAVPAAPAPKPATAAAPVPAPAPAAAPAPEPVAGGVTIQSPKAVQHVSLQAEALFATNKSTLTKKGRHAIDRELAKVTDPAAIIAVAVVGHTDSRGKKAMNQKLSERRAAAVKAYLESKGIPGDKITAVGKGEMEPVASNKSKHGRAKNRRVDVDFKS